MATGSKIPSALVAAVLLEHRYSLRPDLSWETECSTQITSNELVPSHAVIYLCSWERTPGTSWFTHQALLVLMGVDVVTEVSC